MLNLDAFRNALTETQGAQDNAHGNLEENDDMLA